MSLIAACTDHDGFVVTFDSSEQPCPVCNGSSIKPKTLADFTTISDDHIDQLESMFREMLFQHGYTSDNTMDAFESFVKNFNINNGSGFPDFSKLFGR